MFKSLVVSVLIALTLSGCSGSMEQKSPEQENIEALDEDIIAKNMKLVPEISHFMYVEESDGKFFYEGPCNIEDPDVMIAEKAEGSGMWEIVTDNVTYDIVEVEKYTDGVIIHTIDYVSKSTSDLVMLPTKEPHVYLFNLMGSKDQSYMVSTPYAQNYSSNPCNEDFPDISQTWFLADSSEEGWVITSECQGGPTGIVIDLSNNYLELFGGGDARPMIITGANMDNGLVVINYHSEMNKDQNQVLKIHAVGHGPVKFEFTHYAEYYISEANKDHFPLIEEPCD